MIRICMSCQSDLGKVESQIHSPETITHGLCERCSEKMLYESLGQPLEEFLDSLGVPVLVVDSARRMQTANQAACDLLGKKREDISDRTGGDVIECTHAHRPGGCGVQVHCKTCTIRLAVTRAFETGEPQLGIPAFPDIQFGSEIKNFCLSISTSRVGEFVLLIVEDMRVAAEPRQPERTCDVGVS
ncbi:PAS domain-containing protein [bacterium]|nr:PAS domain-containing protein [bacterium]